MRNLISVFGSPQDVLAAPERQLLNIDGIDKITVKKIKSGVDKVFVKRQLEYLENTHTLVYSYWDDQYPARLKSIYDPPAFLFLKGDLSLIDSLSIGIVGSRTPSEYGKSVTQKLTRELVKNGMTIISGFARGVDTIAHKTALDNNGKTIAVLGNGLNVIYPPENKVLLDGFSKNGLMISEFPKKKQDNKRIKYWGTRYRSRSKKRSFVNSYVCFGSEQGNICCSRTGKLSA